MFVILDPIDGSNNLRPWRTPSPFVSVSVAIGWLTSLDGKATFNAIDSACVLDIFNQRLYSAKRNSGASVAGFGKLTSSPNNALEEAILGIDLDLQGDVYKNQIVNSDALLSKVKCKRRLGSSILDFMKVACGEYDAFCSLTSRMKIYDISAAKLIVEESGGVFEIVSEPLSKNLIKTLIETNDKSLIKKNTFSVIASGNRSLHHQIKTELFG